MLDDDPSIGVWDTREEISDRVVCLLVDLSLGRRDWFWDTRRRAVILRLVTVNDFLASLLDNRLTYVVSNSVNLLRQGIRFDSALHMVRQRYGNLRCGCWAVRPLTVTMKTMASCSREISLHAVVRYGLPIGTNSNPGGGVR